MPEYISQNAFAKRVGVSKQAISLAVKEGRVVRTARGIDPSHPTNNHYVRLLNLSRGIPLPDEQNAENLDTPDPHQEPGEGTNKNTAAAPRKPPGRSGSVQYRAPSSIPNELVTAGKNLDNQIKALKLSREKIRYFEEIRRSVPTTIMQRALATIGASVQTQFMMFDERNADALFDAIKAGATREEFRAQLRQLIGDAMRAVVDVTEKTVQAMKTTHDLENDDR